MKKEERNEATINEKWSSTWYSSAIELDMSGL